MASGQERWARVNYNLHRWYIGVLVFILNLAKRKAPLCRFIDGGLGCRLLGRLGLLVPQQLHIQWSEVLRALIESLRGVGLCYSLVNGAPHFHGDERIGLSFCYRAFLGGHIVDCVLQEPTVDLAIEIDSIGHLQGLESCSYRKSQFVIEEFTSCRAKESLSVIEASSPAEQFSLVCRSELVDVADLARAH